MAHAHTSFRAKASEYANLGPNPGALDANAMKMMKQIRNHVQELEKKKEQVRSERKQRRLRSEWGT